MWTIVVSVFVTLVVIGILLFFTHFYHNKDVGKNFLRIVKNLLIKRLQKCIIINRECIDFVMVFL